MKQKNLKKFLRMLVCFLLFITFVLSEGVTIFAATEDDFGKFVASTPTPKNIKVDWHYAEDFLGYEKNEKFFTIKMMVNGNKKNLYLSFPSIGGFRLENEKPAESPKSVEETGIFEPESNNKINYKSDLVGNIIMSSADGTIVKFSSKTNEWEMDVYDNNNIKLFSLTPKQIAFGYSTKEEKYVKTILEMPLAKAENIYGTGERFSGVNQTGKRTMMWNADSYDTGKDDWRGYKNIPIVHSSRGYSLFYNSTCCATVDIGYTNEKKYTFNFSDSRLDFYVWTGTPLENIEKFTDLTGKSILPPKWAFQYQAGGSNGYWWELGKSNSDGISQLNRMINAYEELETPLNVVYGEAIVSNFAQPYNILSSLGSKMLKWNCAEIDFTEAATLMGEIPQNKLPYVVKASNPFQRVSILIDYTNPLGVELRKRQLKQYIDWGCRGGMLDFAEVVPEDTAFYNGLTGDRMHNFYSYFYAKAYYKAYEELTNSDHLTYIRAATAGTQKWSGVWAGDQAATWDGLRKQVSAGLSIGTSGFSIWGFDIAGLDGDVIDEFYNRSLEFAAFSPLMRTGGNMSKLPNEYGKQVGDTYKKVYWLRENLLNTIYSSAIKSNITGLPMMRAMGVAFPNEIDLWNIEDQYIFCNDFLVCPVIKGETYYRSVILPEGNWYDLWSGKKYKGNKTIEADAPYDAIPVYLKSGSVIPVITGQDLNLSTKFTDEEAVESLIVTPPDYERTSLYYPDEKNMVEYLSKPLSTDTFRISNKKGNTASNIIAYGVSAYSVKVDGNNLKRLQQKPLSTDEIGYYIDSSNKTYIYIGTNKWNNIDITLGSITQNNLIKTFNDSVAEVLLNDNFNDTYHLNNEGLVANLYDESLISSVSLKWTIHYAEQYDVDVSTDGANWINVAKITEGLGGIDNITFEPIQAKYVRISNPVTSQNALPTLYSIATYKPINNANINVDSNDSFIIEDTENSEISQDEEVVIIKRRRKKKINNDVELIYGLEAWQFYIIISVVSALLIGGLIFVLLTLRHKKRKKMLSNN